MASPSSPGSHYCVPFPSYPQMCTRTLLNTDHWAWGLPGSSLAAGADIFPDTVGFYILSANIQFKMMNSIPQSNFDCGFKMTVISQERQF